ncbi:MAG: hypothetical protein KAS93_00690 [Gammaproteobacteria bacterium]|nr:hypothetical protein [Gammaproteobacteria bacterium]
MCTKVLAIVFTIIALILAILVTVWHQQGLALIIYISRFFDVMIPILAVGALLKYLFHGTSCDYKKD